MSKLAIPICVFMKNAVYFTVEKPSENQTSIRLASHLAEECLTPNLEDVSLNPLRGHEPGTLII